jgi:hypothetical protein
MRDTMATEIFKVQVDATGKSVLIYNQKRDVMHQLHGRQARDLKHRFKIEALAKIYVRGILTGSLLDLREPVEAQDW